MHPLYCEICNKSIAVCDCFEASDNTISNHVTQDVTQGLWSIPELPSDKEMQFGIDTSAIGDAYFIGFKMGRDHHAAKHRAAAVLLLEVMQSIATAKNIDEEPYGEIGAALMNQAREALQKVKDIYMPRRPDYIKCVTRPSNDSYYCKRIFYRNQWSLVDIEHAENCIKTGNYTVPCKMCMKYIEKEKSDETKTTT